MKYAIIFVLILLAGAAQAQYPYFGVYPNEIGLYNTSTPTGADSECYIDAPSGMGSFPMYLVISNAIDETTGEPITNIGGYELSMTLPPGWDISVTYPCGIVVTPEDPPFYVSCPIPVMGMFTVLAEVLISSWGGGATGPIYLSPFTEGTPSIPGHMAITNADNGDALSRAYPASGGYEYFVTGINIIPGGMRPVPTTETSWGAVKATFR
ncbi:MAG: hypothetical protein GY838_14245 [bacterium]|nr:hypothetical protein [bacterium]